MFIDLKKTLTAIDKCLSVSHPPGLKQLHKMFDLTVQLMSQILSVIYDQEAFGPPTGQELPPLAKRLSTGGNSDRVVTLTLREPLPAMKHLSESVEEHWKAMIHTAIAEAASLGPLPYFEKALVEIEIITPRGTNNSRVWDTSNRAINVIINNLKGIFFRDDNMEHMAFSVVGCWGEEGVTIIHILAFDK